MARGCRDLSVALSPLGIDSRLVHCLHARFALSHPAGSGRRPEDAGGEPGGRRVLLSATASRTSSPRRTATGTSVMLARATSCRMWPGSMRRWSKAGIPLTVLPGSRDPRPTIPSSIAWNSKLGSYCHLGDGDSFTLLEFPWDARRYPVGRRRLWSTWIKERGMTPMHGASRSGTGSPAIFPK